MLGLLTILLGGFIFFISPNTNDPLMVAAERFAFALNCVLSGRYRRTVIWPCGELGLEAGNHDTEASADRAFAFHLYLREHRLGQEK